MLESSSQLFTLFQGNPLIIYLEIEVSSQLFTFYQAKQLIFCKI